MSPLIITRVCPWLINHLSDPWNFNKSNRILLRSNWRKPYPKFYGSELLIKGWSRKLARRYPPYLLGGVINPVLALIKSHQVPGEFPFNSMNHWQKKHSVHQLIAIPFTRVRSTVPFAACDLIALHVPWNHGTCNRCRYHCGAAVGVPVGSVGFDKILRETT